IFTTIMNAAKRVPSPNTTSSEQIASDNSAKIRLTCEPMWTGLGKREDICEKWVIFSSPCLKNNIAPNTTRSTSKPKSLAPDPDPADFAMQLLLDTDRNASTHCPLEVPLEATKSSAGIFGLKICLE